MLDHPTPASPFVEIDSADDAGTDEKARALPGDGLIPDAKSQITRGIAVDATPTAIWPWLMRMALPEADAAGADAARARRVLLAEPPHALVLGSLYDYGERRQLPFDAHRPAQYWHATWALVLTPVGARRTRLHVRSRVAFTLDAIQWTAVWMHPFNDFMASDLLRELKRHAEGCPSSEPAAAREARETV